MPRPYRPRPPRSAARRPVLAWLGCLALLLQLLMLPLSSAEPVASKRLHGWGGYCHAGMQMSMNEHAGHDAPQAPASAEHCLCGASAAALGGLPGLPASLPPTPPGAAQTPIVALVRLTPAPLHSPAQPRAPPYA